jgi:hypothetical protein
MGVRIRPKTLALGTLVLTALLPLAPAQADSDGARRPRYGVRIVLPPERHVVEAVRPPYTGNYQINGRMFFAQSRTCQRWIPGERIRLLRGDWNGACSEAVFYNLDRGATCRMACGGYF